MTSYSTTKKMSYPWKNLFWGVLATLAAYIALNGVAHAASVDLGGGPGVFTAFDPIDALAEGQGTTFMNKIAGLVTNTFFILATIELAWAAALWVIEKDNMSSFTAEMIQKMMFLCFFFILLQNGPEWLPIIIDSFREAGQEAIGDEGPLTPDTIVATGFAIVNLIWSESPLLQTEPDFSDGFDALDGCLIALNIAFALAKLALEVIKLVTPDNVDEIIDAVATAPCKLIALVLYLPEIIVAMLATIVVVVAHLIIAVQLLALNIESYILLAAGAIFLGFGGSRWTNEYVTKVFSYALTVGFRLLVLILILGLSRDIVRDIAGNFEFEILPMLQLAGVSVVQALLALRAPEMASSFMRGEGTGMSLGGMAASARSIAAGAKMLKSGIQAPGKAVSSAIDKGTKVKNFLKGSDKKDAGSVKGL